MYLSASYILFAYYTGLANAVENEIMEGDEGADDIGQVPQVPLYQVPPSINLKLFSLRTDSKIIFSCFFFDRTISNAKIKTVKLTVVVVLGHLFCSVPYVFIQLYTVWGNPTHAESELVQS